MNMKKGPLTPLFCPFETPEQSSQTERIALTSLYLTPRATPKLPYR